jgi:hypothetical protein
MSRRDEPALWRLFDATVRAENERTLTLATQQIGPLPTAPGGRTALPRLGRVRLRPSSIRASLPIDIAGFSGTTRVFQTQVPPRHAKRARQMSPSVARPRQPNIWYATAADALHRGETFGHVTGAGRRQRTIRSGTQQFVADHAPGRQ